MENNIDKTNFLTIGCETNSNQDLFTKQQQQLKVMILFIRFKKNKFWVQEEAKFAFVLGAKMARMQVEIERQGLENKRSSLYDIVCIYQKIEFFLFIFYFI